MREKQVEMMRLEEIKNIIKANIGKQIHITERNKQGKKIREYGGLILNFYDNLFVVKVVANKYYLNKSFTYIDFLTNELIFEITS